MSYAAGEASVEQPLGLICPRCHCPDVRVRRTVKMRRNRVLRYRACRHCGRRFSTVEMLPKDISRP